MHTGFSKDSLQAFKDARRDGPVHMLNLIRLKETARYSDGRTVSGAEAYRDYMRLTGPLLGKVGGRVVWRGDFEMMMVGPADERWDLCFIAEYPDVDAFLRLMDDPAYRQALPHRQAAVADSRLVRLDPRT